MLDDTHQCRGLAGAGTSGEHYFLNVVHIEIESSLLHIRSFMLQKYRYFSNWQNYLHFFIRYAAFSPIISSEPQKCIVWWYYLVKMVCQPIHGQLQLSRFQM